MIDAGSQIPVKRIKEEHNNGEYAILWASNDNATWSEIDNFMPPPGTINDHTLGSVQSYRYWKISLISACCLPGPYHMVLDELEFYSTGSQAIHTTGATQIDGGSNFWEWQTFTPTYTKPANTNVQFRFRSSTNSTDWTDWTDYQTPASGSPLNIIPLVTSRTGPAETPTFYKYLQVETKLTSTDGTSNPTLSEYSIGYHTNRPPDKPVAGTVIIGN